MLYSGDKEGYSSRIIHSAEEEQQFREIGLQDYADLPDPEPKIEELAPGEAPTGFVTTEQFDAVAERLAAAESEIERLKQATANEMSSDYNSMTADQLRALLDEKGIEYKARDSKAELIALLG